MYKLFFIFAFNFYHVEYKVSSGELGEDELALTRDLNTSINVAVTRAWPVLLAFIPLQT